jgi:hypothetical protein
MVYNIVNDSLLSFFTLDLFVFDFGHRDDMGVALVEMKKTNAGHDIPIDRDIELSLAQFRHDIIQSILRNLIQEFHSVLSLSGHDLIPEDELIIHLELFNTRNPPIKITKLPHSH